jgi:hypothetical protein|nr:hypothetical protein [Bacteroides intestinalis]
MEVVSFSSILPGQPAHRHPAYPLQNELNRKDAVNILCHHPLSSIPLVYSTKIIKLPDLARFYFLFWRSWQRELQQFI